MGDILKNEILPVALFYLAFCVAFALAEIVVLFVLNWLEGRYWEFVVDVLIRAKVHHGRLIRCLALGGLGLFVAGVVWLSPLVEVVAGGNGNMKVFALVLGLLIVLFLSISVRKAARTEIEKRVYLGVFFVLSVLVYVSTLFAASRSYDRYMVYVNTKLINPTAATVGDLVADGKKDRLLGNFRAMNEKGLCAPIDYSQSRKVGLVNLVLVETDPGLAFGETKPGAADPKDYLRGRACTDGKDTFLLTEWGAWYWVIE